MSAVTYDQVIKLATQLTPQERMALARFLLASLPVTSDEPVTLETIQAEHARRLSAGAFDHVESLRNKYAKPGFDLSDEELRAGIREFANEWEQEMRSLLPN